MKSEKKNRTT